MDKALASIGDKLEEKNKQGKRYTEKFEICYFLVLFFCNFNKVCLDLFSYLLVTLVFAGISTVHSGNIFSR